MSRCTAGHGWTSRKRRLGGGSFVIEKVRAQQEKLLHGRRVVLRAGHRQAIDDVLRPVAERKMIQSRVEGQLAQLDACEEWLSENPVRTLSKATLIAIGILDEDGELS